MNSDRVISVMLLAALVVLAWAHFNPKDQNTYKTVVVDTRIKDTPIEVIKPPQVVVYAPEAKKKLGLPTQIQDNPKEHVTSSTIVDSDLRDSSVITILDESTGKTEVLVQRQPSPWLREEKTGYVRFSYGIKNPGYTVFRMSAQRDLIQTKGWYLGTEGSLDTDSSAFLGLGLTYKW